MRKLMLTMSALSLLTLGAFGCGHSRSYREAKADYHHDRAEEAAEHGHFGKAIHEERKSVHDERAADRAPLP